MSTPSKEVTMKKAVLVGALLGTLVLGGTAAASDPIILPSGQEGCVSQPGDTCTYTSTRDGGYAAGGSTWTLTVEIPANGDPRDTNGDGKLRYVFNASNGPEQGCGFFGPGATVTTNGGADSSVAAGNPFPGASDAVIGEQNDCPTGMISPANNNYTPSD
jgi:hypothetical protein